MNPIVFGLGLSESDTELIRVAFARCRTLMRFGHDSHNSTDQSNCLRGLFIHVRHSLRLQCLVANIYNDKNTFIKIIHEPLQSALKTPNRLFRWSDGWCLPRTTEQYNVTSPSPLSHQYRFSLSHLLHIPFFLSDTPIPSQLFLLTQGECLLRHYPLDSTGVCDSWAVMIPMHASDEAEAVASDGHQPAN